MSEEVNAKVVTKEEALWTKIKEGAENAVMNASAEALIQKEIAAFAELKIKEVHKD